MITTYTLYTDRMSSEQEVWGRNLNKETGYRMFTKLAGAHDSTGERMFANVELVDDLTDEVEASE